MADLASAGDEEYARPISRQRISAAPEVRNISCCPLALVPPEAFLVSPELGLFDIDSMKCSSLQVDTAGMALDEYTGTALAATSMEHLQGD